MSLIDEGGGGGCAWRTWPLSEARRSTASLADIINRDAAVSRVLRVVFAPDFNVKTGQRIYPAADLSEQISAAGTEASGTGT